VKKTPSQLSSLGKWLLTARTQQGLTQKELADRAGISQARVSRIELGVVLPTLPQLIRLADGLAVPLQWFLNGSTVPGTEVQEVSFELQSLGIVDLLVPHAVVPGAFRPIEQVIALAVRGNQPEPRIIEAVPAVLAWNPWSTTLLKAYSRRSDRRTGFRLAWLADIALTIDRVHGFPGGCPQRRHLEALVKWESARKRFLHEDDLGRPATGDVLPPVWKRWKITYDAPLSAFVERARHLQSLLEQRRSRAEVSPQANDE
jgi:transcriptional regulator with XRE-family HTH domain